MTSKRTKLVSLSYASVEAVTFRSVMQRVSWEGHHSMIFLQKRRKLDINWYVLVLLIASWSAYAYGEQGPMHCVPGS